jgi:hypothetical protein
LAQRRCLCGHAKSARRNRRKQDFKKKRKNAKRKRRKKLRPKHGVRKKKHRRRQDPRENLHQLSLTPKPLKPHQSPTSDPKAKVKAPKRLSVT